MLEETFIFTLRIFACVCWACTHAFTFVDLVEVRLRTSGVVSCLLACWKKGLLCFHG